MPFEGSQGLEFKFNSVVYTVTSLSVSRNAGEFNVTSVNLPTANTCLSVYRPGVLQSVEIKADFVGNTLPPTDDTYTLEIAGGGTAAKGAMWGSTASQFTAACTSVQITAQAGELIKGSATFKLSAD